MTLHTQLFRLVVAVEGNALITGLPGTGKTSLVKWSLREVPSDYAVVVYDTAGDFQQRGLCNYVGRFSVNPLDLPTPRVVEILEESLAATYGEYPYLLTPAMAELLHRTVERGARTLSQVRREVLNIAEPHEMDTAYALRRRLVHFDVAQFDKTDVPIRHGASTCVDVSGAG
ncbi:ATPase AAA [Pyrobaculum ferrireducens]|uniref:AAA ATPase n=1 Tax=Pyrobaculum ferrireducens TaxID=1104324 RepID=G7VEZ0_9CREN|nr:ATPase AAA [Pyrobaculum ferrireducens]AET34155.1 AAA ATPase [Pyrobaculum ferrireducens]